MKPTLRGSLPLLLLLAACASSKSSDVAPSAPAPGGAAPPPPPAATAAPAPESAAPTAIGGTASGADRRATSPVSDAAGDGSTAAGPPTTKRLEDVKMETATGSTGSYLVAVRSAAGLVPDEVGKSVNAAASKTDACYAKALKKKPPTGATLYEVTVDPKGAASGVKLVSDAVKDAELAKCLEASLKAVAWPKPTEKAGGKTTIEFAITK